jgi:hypothetical protein
MSGLTELSRLDRSVVLQACGSRFSGYACHRSRKDDACEVVMARKWRYERSNYITSVSRPTWPHLAPGAKENPAFPINAMLQKENTNLSTTTSLACPRSRRFEETGRGLCSSHRSTSLSSTRDPQLPSKRPPPRRQRRQLSVQPLPSE